MPTATADLRAQMGEYFGDQIGDWQPTAFLLDNEWHEHSGVWTPRTGRPVSQTRSALCPRARLRSYRDVMSHGFEGTNARGAVRRFGVLCGLDAERSTRSATYPKRIFGPEAQLKK